MRKIPTASKPLCTSPMHRSDQAGLQNTCKSQSPVFAGTKSWFVSGLPYKRFFLCFSLVLPFFSPSALCEQGYTWLFLSPWPGADVIWGGLAVPCAALRVSVSCVLV